MCYFNYLRHNKSYSVPKCTILHFGGILTQGITVIPLTFPYSPHSQKKDTLGYFLFYPTSIAVLVVLKKVWDLQAGVNRFLARKNDCQNNCGWKVKLSSLLELIIYLWSRVLLFKARFSSLSGRIFVFLHNLYAFERYLSCNQHGLSLSSTFFARWIVSCLNFSSSTFISSLYWRDFSFSQISLSDRTRFLSEDWKPS